MTDFRSILSALDYRDKRVNLDVLCHENGCHDLLHCKGLQNNPALNLITFNNPRPTVGKMDAGGISIDGYPLDILIAKAQAALLGKRGVFIPEGSINKYREPLISSYLLDSSVSVASTVTRQGTAYILVTKSSDIISAVHDRLSTADKKRGMEHFSTQFATTNAELQAGAFNVTKLFVEQDGIHLSKQKLAARSARYLIPYYSVQNYASRLISILSRCKVSLVYRDDEGVHTIDTSLINEVVAAWRGTTPLGAEVAKWEDWCQPASFGYLSLPRLSNRGEFASVPVVGIEKIIVLK
ncbi:hypothetical protein AB4114_22210 [Paenibacillus sp. 2RAB27]|uniref:hypothetical protein n=1 Tax=Paenibacillus sp. 2RAB27 TaxID=3232991 RepID=UPI003F9CA538